MSISIGYNRTVKLAWLETVVGLLIAGKSDKQIYESLLEMLKDQLSPGSDAIRGSREKTITLLLKTWVRVPQGIDSASRGGAGIIAKPNPANTGLSSTGV